MSRYQKGKTNLDFSDATVSGSGISWATCKSAPRSRQITPLLRFLQAGCPSCRPINSVKALKAQGLKQLFAKYALCKKYKVNLHKNANNDNVVLQLRYLLHSDRATTRLWVCQNQCLPRHYYNKGLVAWHSGRTSVSGRRTFPVLRLTCS